jgi:hypothetical protein
MATRLTHLVVDTPDTVALAGWWAEALGWVVEFAEPAEAYVVPPPGEPGVPLVFAPVDDAKAGKNRVHLDLASDTPAAQRALVDRLVASGAKPADVGQGDVPWTVLADPEGNELCVLEPRASYAGTGVVAAVVVDAVDPAALAAFWVEAAGWIPVPSRAGAALRAPSGAGPFLEFVRTGEPHTYKNRWHLDVAGYAGDDRDAAVAHLESLGARRVEVGQSDAPASEVTWVVLADPEDNEFCVLSSR